MSEQPARRMDRPAGVAVLGATGSIGASTLDVMARHPFRYRAVALTANRDADGLFELCLKHRPDYAVLVDAEAGARFAARQAASDLQTELLIGAEALSTVAALPEVDDVMAAIVGAAGLLPTLAAVEAGKRILLANKEALVMAGALFMEAVREHGAQLLPIDSEHNAIFQCMPGGYVPGEAPRGVRRILLTASGGPFRATPLSELARVTPAQACAHPNWVMGRKISVDSATMMNKGLEVIEACWLFDVRPEQVQVVIHPQSVIHSMVDYDDGSVLAELGNPDMRTPIAHALAWPERVDSGVSSLDLFQVARLDFTPPDLDRFPCLRLAYAALHAGGTAPAILNAANEVAVQAFLEERIGFTDIARIIETTLERLTPGAAESLAVILADDARARDCAESLISDPARKVLP